MTKRWKTNHSWGFESDSCSCERVQRLIHHSNYSAIRNWFLYVLLLMQSEALRLLPADTCGDLTGGVNCVSAWSWAQHRSVDIWLGCLQLANPTRRQWADGPEPPGAQDTWWATGREIKLRIFVSLIKKPGLFKCHLDLNSCWSTCATHWLKLKSAEPEKHPDENRWHFDSFYKVCHP